MRLNNITNPSAKLLAFCVMSLMGITSARAAQPEPWQLGFQPAATDMMARITSFNDFLLILMTAITVFVLGLMVYVMVRFNAKANPVPSKTSHNTSQTRCKDYSLRISEASSSIRQAMYRADLRTLFRGVHQREPLHLQMA